MISLGLTSYEMELGFSDLFISYVMELETHGHAQIGKQLVFHEHQFACTSLGLTSYEMELGFSDIFTSYEMELETHVDVQIKNQLGFHEVQIACYH